MQKEDYSIIIFDGYFDNNEFYSVHIERECTKAIELYNIKPFEFFTRCLNLVDEKIKESVDNYNGLIKELNYRVNENYSKDSVDYSLRRLSECKGQILYYLKSNKPFEKEGVRYLTLHELKTIKEELNNQLNDSSNNNAKYLNTLWFKVGLALADGRITKLFNMGMNFSEIARELFPDKPDSHRVYISSSLENKNTDKNIFIDYNKMDKIISYLDSKNMDIDSVFKEIHEKHSDKN